MVATAGVGLWIGFFMFSPGDFDRKEAKAEASHPMGARFVRRDEFPVEVNDRLQYLQDLTRVPGTMTEEDVQTLLEVGTTGVDGVWNWQRRDGEVTPPEILHQYLALSLSVGGVASRLYHGLPVSSEAVARVYARLAEMARAPSPRVRLIAFHALRDGGFYETPEGKALIDEMIRTEKVDYVHHAMVGNMGRYEARKRHAAWGQAKIEWKGGG